MEIAPIDTGITNTEMLPPEIEVDARIRAERGVEFSEPFAQCSPPSAYTTIIVAVTGSDGNARREYAYTMLEGRQAIIHITQIMMEFWIHDSYLVYDRLRYENYVSIHVRDGYGVL